MAPRDDRTPQQGIVITTTRLNIRGGRPSRSAPIVRRVEPGTELTVTALVKGERVSGNDDWFEGDGRTFAWSGGCASFEATDHSHDVPARRRANGSIRPLGDTNTRRVFGDLQAEDAGSGRVTLDPSWVEANIVEISTPILARIGYPSVRVHRKAASPFVAAFEAIENAGLGHRILTCAGTFVPRHKGWDPKRTLSSHTWGIAIDLNTQWNGYGVVPAQIGTRGSLREVVPHFAAQGFAWGGHFQPDKYLDGMHFELARTDV